MVTMAPFRPLFVKPQALVLPLTPMTKWMTCFLLSSIYLSFLAELVTNYFSTDHLVSSLRQWELDS